MVYPDPEVLYAKLTSGDADGISEVASALGTAKSSLNTAAHTVSNGALSAVQHWRGDAAKAFIGRAKSDCEAADAVYQRLHAAEGAVKHAATAYTAMNLSADAVIKTWRAVGHFDDDLKRLFAPLVNKMLTHVQTSYEHQLTTAASGFTSQNTTDGGGGGGGWDEHGNADISGVGGSEATPWTSQGLAYDGKNLLVSSYYDDDPDKEGGQGTNTDPNETNSRVTYVDEETGQEKKNVYLGGGGAVEDENGMPITDDKGTTVPYPPPQHSGGIATDGKHVWVADTDAVYVYDKADMDKQQPGDPPLQPVDVVNTSKYGDASYVTYAEGKLYIGDYTNNKLCEYPLNDNGSPNITTQPHTVKTPDNCQGVLVRDKDFVFSSSDGLDGHLVRQDRDWDGESHLWDPGSWGHRDDIDLEGGDSGNKDGYNSHGIEELVEIDGEIVLAHESGAYGYNQNKDGKDDEPELTRIGLDELDHLDPDGALSPEDAGYETEPSSLAGSAKTIGKATSTLTSTARSLSGVQLTPDVLGEVPAAEHFATAATKYIASASKTIGNGSKRIDEVAHGLDSCARNYRKVESSVTDGLNKIGAVFGKPRRGFE